LIVIIHTHSVQCDIKFAYTSPYLAIVLLTMASCTAYSWSYSLTASASTLNALGQSSMILTSSQGLVRLGAVYAWPQANMPASELDSVKPWVLYIARAKSFCRGELGLIP
jgi:hypothetical protein